MRRLTHVCAQVFASVSTFCSLVRLPSNPHSSPVIFSFFADSVHCTLLRGPEYLRTFEQRGEGRGNPRPVTSSCLGSRVEIQVDSPLYHPQCPPPYLFLYLRLAYIPSFSLSLSFSLFYNVLERRKHQGEREREKERRSFLPTVDLLRCFCVSRLSCMRDRDRDNAIIDVNILFLFILFIFFCILKYIL